MISASMLYDYVQCPHRVRLDLFADPHDRDDVSAFVELLWERGNAFERNVIEALEEPFLNLKDEPLSERERLTREAMASRQSLIYGGRILSDDLLGEPDLLRLEGNGYVPGDIKSGAATEHENDDEDGKPKKHYAVQLSLYADILRRMGLTGGGHPFVWDIHGEEVAYDLNSSRGPRIKSSMWDEYLEALKETRALATGRASTTGAWASICNHCHWRTLCKSELEATDDLTLIPELGRAAREKLSGVFTTVAELAAADLGPFIQGSKTTIQGVGASTLTRFHARARLQKEDNPKPYFLEAVPLPHGRLELFFDVETDPMRGICYLHGFLERINSDQSSEHYVPFLADQPSAEAEELAFANAWKYVEASDPSALFYYSPYEKTIWRQLAERYPGVATTGKVDELFESEIAFDLYHDLVRSKMIWPTRSLGIKHIATFLGFSWRDKDPSGAASIQWYHEWVEHGDDGCRQRILEYNEDDCIAMRVLTDAVRDLRG
jgi:uncharacterized protein